MGTMKRRGSKLIKRTSKRRILETHNLSSNTIKKNGMEDKDDQQQFENYLHQHGNLKSAFSPNFSEAKIQEENQTVDANDVTSQNDILQHAKELAELENIDPAFYQFLLENDRDLLGFGKEQQQEKIIKDVEENIPSNGLPITNVSRGTQLTFQRFKLICRSAQDSQSARGLSLLLAAYRGVIRSIVEMDDVSLDINRLDPKLGKKNFKQKQLIVEGQETKNSSDKQKKTIIKPVKLFFHLNFNTTTDDSLKDEESEALIIFNEVVSTVLETLESLLPRHIQLDEKSKADKKNGTSSECGQESSFNIAKLTYPKPSSLKRHYCTLINNFWSDTILLLNYFYGKPTEVTRRLQKNCLVHLASPLLLRWLVCLPNHVRSSFVSSLAALWLEARKRQTYDMDEPIAAFAVLRSLLDIVGQPKFHSVIVQLCTKGERATDIQIQDMCQEAQQALLSDCYKAFTHLVSKVGYSWRVAPGYQFALNCLVELLSGVHSSVAYRLSFLAVRQLGLTVRNAAILRSQQKSGLGGAAEVSAAKLRLKRLDAAERQLFSWPFILSARFLVQGIGKLGRQLKPLSFPLSTIFTAIVKSELNISNHTPFVLHCLQLQCDLMSFLDIFIPMGSHLIALGTSLILHQEKLYRPLAITAKVDSRRKKQKKTLSNPTHIGNKIGQQQLKSPSGIAAKAKIQKTPDIDIVTRVSDAQLEMPDVVNELTTRWIDICINYMGLLSRHPSFPETSMPLTVHLKKLSKTRVELVRKELKKLLVHCETSITEVRQKRFSLDPLNDVSEGKLLLLAENDITLAKYRASRLAQQKETYMLKVNAEMNRITTEEVPDKDFEDAENGNLQDIDSEVTKSNDVLLSEEKEQEFFEIKAPDNDVSDIIEEFNLDSEPENEDAESDESDEEKTTFTRSASSTLQGILGDGGTAQNHLVSKDNSSLNQRNETVTPPTLASAHISTHPAQGKSRGTRFGVPEDKPSMCEPIVCVESPRFASLAQETDLEHQRKLHHLEQLEEQKRQNPPFHPSYHYRHAHEQTISDENQRCGKNEKLSEDKVSHIPLGTHEKKRPPNGKNQIDSTESCLPRQPSRERENNIQTGTNLRAIINAPFSKERGCIPPVSVPLQLPPRQFSLSQRGHQSMQATRGSHKNGQSNTQTSQSSLLHENQMQQRQRRSTEITYSFGAAESDNALIGDDPDDPRNVRESPRVVLSRNRGESKHLNGHLEKSLDARIFEDRKAVVDRQMMIEITTDDEDDGETILSSSVCEENENQLEKFETAEWRKFNPTGPFTNLQDVRSCNNFLLHRGTDRKESAAVSRNQTFGVPFNKQQTGQGVRSETLAHREQHQLAQQFRQGASWVELMTPGNKTDGILMNPYFDKDVKKCKNNLDYAQTNKSNVVEVSNGDTDLVKHSRRAPGQGGTDQREGQQEQEAPKPEFTMFRKEGLKRLEDQTYRHRHEGSTSLSHETIENEQSYDHRYEYNHFGLQSRYRSQCYTQPYCDDPDQSNDLGQHRSLESLQFESVPSSKILSPVIKDQAGLPPPMRPAVRGRLKKPHNIVLNSSPYRDHHHFNDPRQRTKHRHGYKSSSHAIVHKDQNINRDPSNRNHTTFHANAQDEGACEIISVTGVGVPVTDENRYLLPEQLQKQCVAITCQVLAGGEALLHQQTPLRAPDRKSVIPRKDAAIYGGGFERDLIYQQEIEEVKKRHSIRREEGTKSSVLNNSPRPPLSPIAEVNRGVILASRDEKRLTTNSFTQERVDEIPLSSSGSESGADEQQSPEFSKPADGLHDTDQKQKEPQQEQLNVTTQSQQQHIETQRGSILPQHPLYRLTFDEHLEESPTVPPCMSSNRTKRQRDSISGSRNDDTISEVRNGNSPGKLEEQKLLTTTPKRQRSDQEDKDYKNVNVCSTSSANELVAPSQETTNMTGKSDVRSQSQDEEYISQTLGDQGVIESPEHQVAGVERILHTLNDPLGRMSIVSFGQEETSLDSAKKLFCDRINHIVSTVFVVPPENQLNSAAVGTTALSWVWDVWKDGTLWSSGDNELNATKMSPVLYARQRNNSDSDWCISIDPIGLTRGLILVFDVLMKCLDQTINRHIDSIVNEKKRNYAKKEARALLSFINIVFNLQLQEFLKRLNNHRRFDQVRHRSEQLKIARIMMEDRSTDMLSERRKKQIQSQNVVTERIKSAKKLKAAWESAQALMERYNLKLDSDSGDNIQVDVEPSPNQFLPIAVSPKAPVPITSFSPNGLSSPMAINHTPPTLNHHRASSYLPSNSQRHHYTSSPSVLNTPERVISLNGPIMRSPTVHCGSTPTIVMNQIKKDTAVIMGTSRPSVEIEEDRTLFLGLLKSIGGVEIQTTASDNYFDGLVYKELKRALIESERHQHDLQNKLEYVRDHSTTKIYNEMLIPALSFASLKILKRQHELRRQSRLLPPTSTEEPDNCFSFESTWCQSYNGFQRRRFSDSGTCWIPCPLCKQYIRKAQRLSASSNPEIKPTVVINEENRRGSELSSSIMEEYDYRNGKKSTGYRRSSILVDTSEGTSNSPMNLIEYNIPLKVDLPVPMFCHYCGEHFSYNPSSSPIVNGRESPLCSKSKRLSMGRSSIGSTGARFSLLSVNLDDDCLIIDNYVGATNQKGDSSDSNKVYLDFTKSPKRCLPNSSILDRNDICLSDRKNHFSPRSQDISSVYEDSNAHQDIIVHMTKNQQTDGETTPTERTLVQYDAAQYSPAEENILNSNSASGRKSAVQRQKQSQMRRILRSRRTIDVWNRMHKI